jgi:type IV pilus assembly protein PilB
LWRRAGRSDTLPLEDGLSPTLGDLLLQSGALREEDLNQALGQQRHQGITLAQALIQGGFVEEKVVIRALAKESGMPFVDLDKGSIKEDVLDKLPREFALEQGVVPVMQKGGKLVVAIDDPVKRLLVDQLTFVVDCEVTCALATPSALAKAVRLHFGEVAEDAVASSMGADADDEGEGPIIRLVTRMFADALELRASDIHVEPGHGRVRIRYRIDGVLRDIAEHPEHLASPLLSRLKIMAAMDIAEKRKPQDGRISLEISGRAVDVRASILPSSHGESMVLRLLDKSANLLSLRDLGFDDESHAWFRKIIERPHGICLVTGPTGSGKTTTLYAALSELNRSDIKIITAEDPVEYHIHGINQVQVNPRVGMTFSRILKAMLRCAPNVILVGEIRDLETAEIAIQAALTGHLVFSTVHTNNAPSAITRLQDLGVAPFLVSASIQSIIAQRLVRRLCKECAEEYEPEPEEFASLALDPSQVQGRTFRRPRGCPACEGAGFRGRVALFETFEMDADLREMTFRQESLEKITEAAEGSGKLQPLVIDGARKVLQGVTSVSEVLRVTRSGLEEAI